MQQPGERRITMGRPILCHQSLMSWASTCNQQLAEALSSQGSRQGCLHCQGLQCLAIAGGLRYEGAWLTSVLSLSSPPPSAGAGAHVQRHAACGRPARFGAVVHWCAALCCAVMCCTAMSRLVEACILLLFRLCRLAQWALPPFRYAPNPCAFSASESDGIALENASRTSQHVRPILFCRRAGLPRAPEL